MTDIIKEVENGVLRIGFNRPERKNAITAQMYRDLGSVLTAAQTDASIRVVVLHGSETVFTSGNDIKDFANREGQSKENPSEDFMRSVLSLGKPLIAAVNGHAVGIGATMLLHCDLVYAGESASLQFPFVKLGLCPEFGSSLLLPSIVGWQRAAELFLLGVPCSAARAETFGLVNQVLAPEDVLPHALSVASTLASLPPGALRVTKSLMRQGQAAATEQRLDQEFSAFRERLRSPEAKEAFAAFLEKRSPDFSAFS
jgi:enoyl-CoA hydratase/carnithine racemase